VGPRQVGGMSRNCTGSQKANRRASSTRPTRRARRPNLRRATAIRCRMVDMRAMGAGSSSTGDGTSAPCTCDDSTATVAVPPGDRQPSNNSAPTSARTNSVRPPRRCRLAGVRPASGGSGAAVTGDQRWTIPASDRTSTGAAWRAGRHSAEPAVRSRRSSSSPFKLTARKGTAKNVPTKPNNAPPAAIPSRMTNGCRRMARP